MEPMISKRTSSSRISGGSPWRVAQVLLASSALCAPCYVAAQSSNDSSKASVKRVQVLGNRTPIEIEIEGTERLTPQAQVLTGPDRLVVDFPNATPGALARNQNLNRGEVRGVRVGLFSTKPPVTRVVFDLTGPQAYQVFPAGRTVIIKLGEKGAQAAAFTPATSGAKLVTTNYPVQSVQITPPPALPPPPPLIVTFKNGMLSVTSNKANLSEVLFEIHKRTGAEIAIPAGAEQEKVVAEIGPAAAPQVLAHLLNGSRFNFLIMSSAGDPNVLDKVILSARPDGPGPASRPLPQVPVQQAQAQSEDNEDVPRNDPPPQAGPHPNPAAGPGVTANPIPGNGDSNQSDNVAD